MVQLLLPERPGPGLGAVGSEASKRTNSASTPWLLQPERILKGNRPCANGLCRTRAELGRATRFSSLVAAPGPEGLISNLQASAMRAAVSLVIRG
jgi:hypothetical protein